MSTKTEQVVLQVGDRRFFASIDLLRERSLYFRVLFSGNWAVKKQDDGSIFLDGDGAAFEHVMTYIRRGVFPLAFDPVKGHDHLLYFKVLQEARYFQCPHLITWLEGQFYYRCVSRVYKTSIEEDFRPTVKQDSSITEYKLTAHSKTDKKMYLCPRGILVHYGSPEKCGRQCANARGDQGPMYDIESRTSEWMATQTSLVFNHGWMSDFGEEYLRYFQHREASPEST